MLHLTPQKSGSVCELYFFGEEGLKNAFNKLHWRKDRNKILDSNGNELECGICHKKIKEENISAFFPGSAKVACDKPGCFMAALSKSKKIIVEE